MLEWSTAGYFPNDLLIKRNIDGRFIPLSEMSRVYGRNPFTAGPSPRGISNVETNEHINQQQYLHHLLMQQQQQQLLAQQQLLMLHHQNSNLNSMLLNKAINPALMKPGAEALLSGVGKQTEEKLTLPMRNQNFDLSPEISTSIAPSFDPIKSLLNQLKESNNSFLPPADEKESSISPQHVQQPQHQMAPQMQHQQAPLGHQQSLSQTLIPAAQVQMSQEHQRSAMQFNQQQQATTMAIDQQLQAQLAAIGVKMSQPAPAPVQVDPVSRLQETVRQESLEVNQADMIGTEKRQSIPNQVVILYLE
jgi:PERQ amino acid-rich with GYF domain-containing protein